MLRIRVPRPTAIHLDSTSRVFKVTVICLAAWAAHVTGATGAIDGWVYDQVHGLPSSAPPLPVGVVLVEFDPCEVGGEGAALALVEELQNLGARGIGWTALPDGLSTRFFDAASQRGRVVFPRRLSADGASLLPLPAGADPSRHEFAIASVGLATSGVHRAQSAWVRLQEGVIPFIETALAPEAHSRVGSELHDRYLLRFQGDSGELPRIDSRMLLAHEVVRDVIAGRVALIGFRSDRASRMVELPTGSRLGSISRLEFHGHALNTLLSSREILPLAGWLLALIFLLAGFVVWQISQLLDVRSATWAVCGFAVVVLGVSWVLLDRGSRWLPAGDLGLAQVGVFVYALRSRATAATRAMTTLALASAQPLRDREPPPSFNECEDPWSLVASLVHQTLDLDRVVFLAGVPGKSTLVETAALGCSPDAIAERRRDWERTPYITAIEERGPLRVEDYLLDSTREEEQFLVPLLRGDEVLGFWGFGVPSTRVAANPQFVATVARYGEIISDLIWSRKISKDRQRSRAKLERAMRLGRVEGIYRQLNSLVNVLSMRLARSESFLDGFNIAVSVYDSFGRPLAVNRRMAEVLAPEGLDGSRMSALDLVTALSEHDIARSRKVLRHVLVDEQALTIPATLASRKDRRYLLHVKPLELDGEERGDSEFGIGSRCILCELVDTSPFVGLFELKEKLTKRLGLQLRNDLASIEMSSSILTAKNITDNQRETISQVIHEKVAKMMDVLVECQQYLTLESGSDSVERFPVDSTEYLASALKRIESKRSGRDISVDVERPGVMSYVLASSEELEAAFEAILRVLLVDAVEGTRISVKVVEEAEAVVFAFENTGFGIPNERFREYLFGEKALATDELRSLRESIRWVQAWGGSIDAESHVGQGTRATLRLVKFL